MLTKADDFPIHQTPEPIAFSGSDRNFYDRYFFNGYGPSGEDFFAIAFGVYPVSNIADAHFACVRGDLEHCIHASRILNMERMDLAVGPISIEIIEPLKKLRVVVDASDEGIAADLVFEGRAFPIEEPRFTHRVGPRIVTDYTRLTQNGRWSGWIEVDGIRRDLAEGAVGTRDRSWGVRPVGGGSDVPVMPTPSETAVLWRWCPTNFDDHSLFFHVQRDLQGDYLNTRSAAVADGGDAADIAHFATGEISTNFQRGTRYATDARLTLQSHDGEETVVTYVPIGHRFLMRGIGYFNPEWPHGGYKGPLVVEREDIDLANVDPLAVPNIHVQAVARATSQRPGESPRVGIGVVEQIVLGPYAPLGFKATLDPATGA